MINKTGHQKDKNKIMFSYHQVVKGVVPSSHYKSAKKLLELLRACPLLAVFLLVSAKIKEEC